MATAGVIGYPMVNAGNLYVYGLDVSWVSTTALSIAAGAARDNSNINDIILPSAASISSAVNGVGGLDTGTIAASTFYSVYVIGSSLSANPETNIATQVSTIGGTTLNGTVLTQTTVATPASTVDNNFQPAGLISLSATQPVLPEGYDMFRRVGYVLTDGASHFLAFLYSGYGNSRTMWYDVGIQVLNAGASAAYANVSLAVAVPAISPSINVLFDTIITPTGAGNSVSLKPFGSASVNGYAIMSGDVAAVAHEDTIMCPAKLNAGVATVSYKVTGTVTLNVSGYVDQL